MHHAGEGTVVGKGRQECGGRVAVGHVAGGDGDFGTQPVQLGDEFGAAGRVRSATAGEEEMPDAVLGDEVAGDERAQSAGASGDQDGALPVPGNAVGGRGGRGRRHQPRNQDLALAQREFVLTGGECAVQSGLGGG